MVRNLSIFLLMFFSLKAFAYEDKVAVVVNNDIITEKEISDRKNFFIKVNNAHHLSTEEHSFLKKMAIQTLIDEILLEEQAKKYSLDINAKEIQYFIKNIEESRKLGVGFFKRTFSNDKSVYSSFLKKIRGDYIKLKINNEILMRGIAVYNTELDNVAIRYVGKDALFVIREFNTNLDSDKAYKVLREARKTQKDCNKTIKSKDYTVTSWSKKLSELPKSVGELLVDLKDGEFSVIIDKEEGGLAMYQVCSKKVEGLTEQENDNLTNYLGNKKLNFKMMKYLETIRSKAYIKYMN